MCFYLHFSLKKFPQGVPTWIPAKDSQKVRRSSPLVLLSATNPSANSNSGLGEDVVVGFRLP
jgi:hypothetical protein